MKLIGTLHSAVCSITKKTLRKAGAKASCMAMLDGQHLTLETKTGSKTLLVKSAVIIKRTKRAIVRANNTIFLVKEIEWD